MAKINTTNYQPVTAWNGTQDLLIVEQPDGTKVATPEQVKQYVESFYDDMPIEGSERAVKSGGIFNSISEALGCCRIAVFEKTFTGVNISNPWGSLYESTNGLQFDISSLGLQTVPKFAIVALKSSGAALLFTAGTPTATAVSFRPIRPSAATDLTIVATLLVLY